MPGLPTWMNVLDGFEECEGCEGQQALVLVPARRAKEVS